MNEDHERYEPCTADCVLRMCCFCVLCFVATEPSLSLSWPLPMGWNSRFCTCRAIINSPRLVVVWVVLILFRSGEENGVEGWNVPSLRLRDRVSISISLFYTIFCLFHLGTSMLVSSDCRIFTLVETWARQTQAGGVALTRYFSHHEYRWRW